MRALTLSIALFASAGCGGSVRVTKYVSAHEAAYFHDKVEVTGIEGRSVSIPSKARVYTDSGNPDGIIMAEEDDDNCVKPPPDMEQTVDVPDCKKRRPITKLEPGERVEISGLFVMDEPIPGGGKIVLRDNMILRAVGIGMLGVAIIMAVSMATCPFLVPDHKDECLAGLGVPAVTLGLAGFILFGTSYIQSPQYVGPSSVPVDNALLRF